MGTGEKSIPSMVDGGVAMELNNPITSKDGPRIMEMGVKMVRKPDPVFVYSLPEFTSIDASPQGLQSGHKGDYVAYDPMTGRVWPVDAGYLEVHYEVVEDV